MTNFFKWYGIGNGFSTGDALNRNAPVLTGPAGSVFGAPTFQPGDVWVTINFNPPSQGRSLYVNFKGTNNFRFYPMNGGDGAFGARVDQSTGNVYFTDFFGGTISQLNPSTNAVTVWTVGGHPHYIAIDSSGKVYSAVATAGVAGGVDAIVRINPSTNNVVSWAIPGGGLTSVLAESTPDGVNFDTSGSLWFSLSSSTAVGRLTPSTGEIAEFTAPGILNPQLIASTGSGALLQTFFTEGDGNSATIITQATAVPSADTIVMPSSASLTPASLTTSFTDSIRDPLTTTITPLVVSVPGTNPASGIVRFPMPTPMGGNAAFPNFPDGMTGVVLPATIFGSYLDPDFAHNSAVFQVTSPGVIIAPPPPPPTQIKVSKFFTDTSLNPLPLDSNGNPKVDVVLATGVVRSTNPGEIIAWVNLTNTGGGAFQSLKVNETLPVDWVISPPWKPALGAIHVFFANTTSLATNPEITDPTSITVLTGNPETVLLSIPNLNATGIGHPLLPHQTILLGVKLDYGLDGTSQSASSFPRNYTDTASAAAWTQVSFTGTESSASGAAFFIAFAKVLGDVNGDFKVDILDAALLANSYGAKPGDTLWNPSADFNYDGVIDIKDAAALAFYYGTSS